MANRLADRHDVAPALTAAVADRITSGDLHDKALRDLGAFVHRTLVEDDHTYAVRIDDGALLDAAQQVEHARAHLTATDREQLAGSRILLLCLLAHRGDEVPGDRVRRGRHPVNAVSPGVIRTPMHAPDAYEQLGPLH
jgi:hypothetical protein